MTVCAMFGCKNRMHKGCGKHFFRFPMKDPERLVRWMEAMQRDDWKPSVYSKVCSDHFTEKDYMIRPGATCPFLRTDAVPTPLFVQCKKKTRKKKGKKAGGGGAAADEAPGEGQEHPMEEKAAEEEAGPSRDAQEEQGEGQEQEHLMEESPAEETPEKDLGDQEKETHVGEESMEIQTAQSEPRGSPVEGEPEKEMRAEQPPSERMAELDVGTTTQSERQVALILAELEDTHCEMRAAEARAAREAATHNDDQPPGDHAASRDDPLDCVSFDHAYTPLKISDKENNVPSPSPPPTYTPAPAPARAPSTPHVANSQTFKMRKRIKTLQKQVLRQGAKIKSLKQTLGELRRSNLSEKDPQRVIAEHCGGLALALFSTQLKKHRKYSAMQYCNLLKDFALSLHHASPKAYKFCRLFLSLPHPVSLRHWKVAGEGNQGALQEVLIQSQDPQDEDILAGALQAVALEAEVAQGAAE